MGFHAPQEMARLLGESIDLSRQAQVKAAQLLGGAAITQAPPPAVAPASMKR
jgi:nitrite reductase (cytochrome c-552)